MSEVFDKKTWVDRQSQHPNRRRLTNVSTSEETVYDVAREEGTVDVAGHPFNASNMNDLEERIEDAVDTLQTNFQAGVDSIYDACVDKGSTPASHSLADVVEAIENISGGGSIVNIFGTPNNNMPSNGTIYTGGSVYVEYHAYQAFGDNENGWVSSLYSGDAVHYDFTDGSSYRLTSVEFCPYFDYFGGTVKDTAVYLLCSTNGEDFDEVAVVTDITTKNTIIKIDLESNNYYKYFTFVVTGQGSSSGYRVGLKNIKCYGEREGGSGKGLDTIKNIFFSKSMVNANVVEIGGNGNDEQYAT